MWICMPVIKCICRNSGSKGSRNMINCDTPKIAENLNQNYDSCNTLITNRNACHLSLKLGEEDSMQQDNRLVSHLITPLLVHSQSSTLWNDSVSTWRSHRQMFQAKRRIWWRKTRFQFLRIAKFLSGPPLGVIFIFLGSYCLIINLYSKYRENEVADKNDAFDWKTCSGGLVVTLFRAWRQDRCNENQKWTVGRRINGWNLWQLCFKISHMR